MAINPIHPFKIEPPKITEKHIDLLKDWASVGASVSASIGDSIWDSVGNSVRASIRASVGASIGASVWDSIGDSARASVRASVWAYIGSIFPLKRKEWKYIEKIKTDGYPFQSAVDLWNMGLVPSFDSKHWRLHGGKKATILWKGDI